MNPSLPSWETLKLIGPELVLTIGMCAVILLPLLRRSTVLLSTLAAVATLIVALAATVATLGPSHSVLSGMLTIDPFAQFFKVILFSVSALVLAQWWITARRETSPSDTPDFLCLLLGATLGMALMASASNLLMIVVAIESASLPSYALAGFRKRSRLATEGSLKYVVFGAAASAVTIYGMSLIYGVTGTLDLPAVAAQAVRGFSPLLTLGLLAMLVGFAFKLSAVPMHFWCPDVFQGASTEVTTFLSIASKGAAMCLLVRVLGELGAAAAGLAPAAPAAALGQLAVAVGALGAVTATWGNLVAMHQTNLKRLLAYSSIAHAGYMIMGASLLVLAGRPGSDLAYQDVTGAILFYLLVYLFMNMGAFTVAALVAQHTGSEDIRDYAALTRRSPALAVLLIVFLLSLFGMPGLGGFWGKIYLALAMTRVGWLGFVLIGVLLFNTLLSFYYYARPIYYMSFVADDADRPSFTPRLAGLAVLVLCAAGLLWTGLLPNKAAESAKDRALGAVSQAAPAALR